MSCPVILRVAPILTVAELKDQTLARSLMFQTGFLRKIGDGDVPVIVDHESRPRSRPRASSTRRTTRVVPLVLAHAELADAPPCLRKKGGVSFAYSAYSAWR